MSEQEIEQEVDTTAENVRAAFDENIGNDEDDIKLSMIGAGATFKNVTKLFNEFMIDAGLAISKEDKASHVTAALEGRSLDTEESYDEAIIALVDSEKGINERSAAALLRAYGKKNELEVYKKPKAEGAGRTSFAKTYYDWLVANPQVGEEAAAEYITAASDASTSDNIKKNLPHYQNIRSLVNRVYENANG